MSACRLDHISCVMMGRVVGSERERVREMLLCARSRTWDKGEKDFYLAQGNVSPAPNTVRRSRTCPLSVRPIHPLPIHPYPSSDPVAPPRARPSRSGHHASPHPSYRFICLPSVSPSF